MARSFSGQAGVELTEEKEDCENLVRLDRKLDVTQRDFFRDKHNVVYNRVPKTGSGPARVFMEKCFKRRGDVTKFFTSFQRKHNERSMDDVLLSVSQSLSSLQTPWLFVGHVNFINFTKYGMKEMPIYVNLVREPVSCFVSMYYFVRFKHPRPMSDVTRNRTFDQCVLENDPECSDPLSTTRLIPFFCGHDPVCATGNNASLALAKKNVLRYYSVVGYLENIEEFYEALEFMLPHVFSGIVAEFRKYGNSREKVSQGKKKVEPSTRAVEECKRRIPHEIELYRFLRHRFDCMMTQILKQKMTSSTV